MPDRNFSSYTYQLSLYMITPDAYEAFINTGRKDINAINNILGIDKAVNSANASRNLNVQQPEQGRTVAISIKH
jgi:hypothetical protein